VINSSASGTIAASTSVGGLIGSANKVNLAIYSSQVDIEINGTNMNQVGGILGTYYGVCYGIDHNSPMEHCVRGSWQSLWLDDTFASGSITGSVGSGSVRIGGLVGYGKSDQSVVKIEDSSSYMKIAISPEADSKDIGGLAGLIKSSAGLSGGDSGTGTDLSDGVIVLGSYALGDIVVDDDLTGSASNVGGLLGNADADDNRMKITNSYAKGNIYGAGLANRIGGLIGYVDVDLGQFIMDSSFAKNYVSGKSKVGGLIGEINTWCGNSTTGEDYSSALCKTAPLTSSITNVYHSGIVLATDGTVGGIIGSAKADDNEIALYNTYQTCNVIATTGRAGGIIGDISITTEDNSSLDTPRDGSLILGSSVAILEDATVFTVSGQETIGRIFGKVNNDHLLTLSDNYSWNGEKAIMSSPPVAENVTGGDLVDSVSVKDGVGVSGLSFVTTDFFQGVFSNQSSSWTTGVGKIGILSAIQSTAQNDVLPDCMLVSAQGDINVPDTGQTTSKLAVIQDKWLVMAAALVIVTATIYLLISRRAHRMTLGKN
jgi:hypothetical protein